MPYEQPLIHKTLKENTTEQRILDQHQSSSSLNQVLVLIGLAVFSAVIIAGYFWWK